eukprot:1007664-Rhodomonas_salina.1
MARPPQPLQVHNSMPSVADTRSRPKVARAAHSIAVFVRIRPLLAQEEKSGDAEGLRVSAKDATAVHVDTLPRPIGGFTGIFQPTADNEAVFRNSISPRIESVANGGTTSLFCYGYTGSGKTHTVLGYNSEAGLFSLAARSLLQSLPREGGLFLAATACEIYGDVVNDLLGPEKVKCKLKCDAAGQLQVTGPSEMKELADVRPDLRDAMAWKGPMETAQQHLTVVTRGSALREMEIRSPEDIDAVTRTSVQQRIVGTSTQHQKSSRSHALLRLEVVTRPVKDARSKLAAAAAAIAPIQNAVDNTDFWFVPETMQEEDPDKFQRMTDDLAARKVKLNEALEQAHASELLAKEELDQVLAAANPAVGGSLVLVDLAGADKDHRSEQDAKGKAE